MTGWTATQTRGFPLLACGRNSLSLPPALNIRTLSFHDWPSFWFTYFLCSFPPHFCYCHQWLGHHCCLCKSLGPLRFFLLIRAQHFGPGSCVLLSLIINVLEFCLSFYGPCRKRWGTVSFPSDSSPQCDYIFLMESMSYKETRLCSTHYFAFD